MRSAIIFAILAIALAHPPRLVEVAKKVNSLHTTWIANEAIPTRDYTQYIGALEGWISTPHEECCYSQGSSRILRCC